MNYKIIHDRLVQLCREKSSKERLKLRNSNDIRLTNGEPLYVEVHHIIPRSLGGNDDMANLIETLPEEHIFFHMLRYKIYQKREDMLAVRCMLNGFASYNRYKGNVGVFLTKKIRMGYAWMKAHTQNFRKKTGWQTEDGRQRISRARKGTMPAKDMETGEIIGAVSINHPNVLSGKWAHHCKGVSHTKAQIEAHRERNLGQKNGNASGLSDEYFIEKGVEISREFGVIFSLKKMLELSKIRNFKWLKSWKSRFDRQGANGYYKIIEEKTGGKYYSGYFKSKEWKSKTLC